MGQLVKEGGLRIISLRSILSILNVSQINDG